jgi:4-carboxymuconolactone decarboxylase
LWHRADIGWINSAAYDPLAHGAPARLTLPGSGDAREDGAFTPRTRTPPGAILMPRLPFPADTDAFPEETRAAMRHILATRKSMPPPSSYLTYAGKAGALLSDLVEHLRYHTSLTDAETELAICLAARAADADFIWNAHVKLGHKAGTREEAIRAVDTFSALDGLTADETLIIRYGRELLEDRKVTDATVEAVRKRWGEKGLLELTATMSVYLMNATILRAMDHRAAPDARHLTPRK